MVSNSSNPPDDFYMDPTGIALPGLSPFSTRGGGAEGVVTEVDVAKEMTEEDLDKKIRKPYTISKSRQSWTEPEHDKFLEALQLFDRDWKKIEAFIGSKTVIQIRSHAQKYFLKVQKSGGNEHLPPPRPKRKAAHPYPHKASKSAPLVPQLMAPFASASASTSLLQPGNVIKHDMPASLGEPVKNAAVGSSWTDNFAHASVMPDESQGSLRPTAEAVALNSCCSAESTPRVQSVSRVPAQANKSQAVRVLPDFAQVYSFIGSVFDPNASDHLHNLKQMDPIDVETVLLLMRNLSINLTSPSFEDHRRVLSDQ